MLTLSIVKALQVYGVAIAISMLVALLIKVMVAATARMEQQAGANEVPTGTVCPVDQGIPDEDVAALSAAIFAAIGPHHILHIAPASHGWATSARASQHSHTPRSR